MDPILVTNVIKDTTNAPILIIDHVGTVGFSIYERVKSELTTVFVSSKQPASTQQIIHIPYKHRFPEIPNGLYSCIIFVAHDEKDLPDLVKKLCAKAKTDGVPFIFITSYRSVQETLIERMINYYEQSYAVILGELFGQGESMLDQYIIQAGATRSISLPHMGLRKVHPVLFSDAIQGILQSIFGIQRHTHITYLYQQHPMTDLSIAHLLQKKDPLLHIDFLRENKKKETEEKHIALHGFYYFDETYPLQEKLLDAYAAASVLRKDEKDSYVHKEAFTPIIDLDEGSHFPLVPEKASGLIKKGIAYFLLLVGFPYVCLVISLLVGFLCLTVAQQSLEKGEVQKGKVMVQVAYGSFAVGEFVSLPIVVEMRTLKLDNVAYQLNRNITIGKSATKSVLAILTAGDMVNAILEGKSTTPQKDALSAVSSVRSSLVMLQNLLVANPDNTELKRMLGKYQTAYTLGAGVIGLLPDILAVNSKHTYLVLLADNTQLRPGGGYIGVYGLVTIDHGKLGTLTIHDIYDADKKLRQHVDPPFAIRRYMGKVHLYLQDSNFDVDFVANAKKASEIFQLETGQRIDGVIGIDVSFLQSLLSATGPIVLGDEKTHVNAQNIFTLAQQHATKPGTLQQDAFLQNVSQEIVAKLTKSQFTLPVLLQKTFQAMNEKHLLFALANIADQNVLTVNHVSSSLWDPRQELSGVVNDYMGISEANIGENKVNYFIKRSIKQSTAIDGEGNLTGEVQITYMNTSTLAQWPGGDYKNYLKIMLPQDTTLQGIAFDGQLQTTQGAITDPIIYEAAGFHQPQTLEVEQTREEGKTIYGFLVTIPATTSRTVTIQYKHDEKINLANPVLHYRLSLYKQPGTSNDPYAFNFNFPLAFTILSAAPANQHANSDYSLTTALSSDTTINIDLTKK